MRTPMCRRDISREWLEVILSEYEAKRSGLEASVKVTSFQANPGAKPGENFNSEVVKVVVEGEVLKSSASSSRGKGSSKDTTPTCDTNPTATTSSIPSATTTTSTTSTTSTTPSATTSTTISATTSSTTSATTNTITYNLFVKFLMGSAMEREMEKLGMGHQRELLIYSHVISELNDFQARYAGDKYRVEVPEFVYGTFSNDEYVLVMRDIGTDGFKTKNKYLGLDLPHILMATERLARLHAVSYAYCQSHNFLEKYPAFSDDHQFYEYFYKPMSHVVLEGVIQTVQKKEIEYELLLAKLKANKEAIIQRFVEVTENKTLTCLAHGDAWTNNFMYMHKDSESEAPTPTDIMLIDWYISRFRNPLLDLHYLVQTSTTLSLRKNHLEEILGHYHATFTNATTDLGAVVDNWKFEDFMQEWQRTRIYGLIFGIICALFTLCEAGKKVNKRDDPSPNVYVNKIGSWMGRLLAPSIMYLLSFTDYILRVIVDKGLNGMIKELVSGENDILQNRVFDLLTEANECGVLDA